jgi:outer membrane protein OmpA-like peptidoglycan-associated protein
VRRYSRVLPTSGNGQSASGDASTVMDNPNLFCGERAKCVTVQCDTVLGELLFALNSDEVRPGAPSRPDRHVRRRQVFIIGHGDAMGDAELNRQLSERRAEVVKQIFVDYFELAAGRLSTEDLGAARPIASNATPEGSVPTAAWTF